MNIEELDNELDKQIKEINDNLIKLRKKKENEKWAKEYPKLKEKYEGKYFKYENGYDGDRRWYLYSYCHEVVNLRECKVSRFQIDTYGKCSFKIQTLEYFHTLSIEIDRDEYIKELNKFENQFKKIK